MIKITHGYIGKVVADYLNLSGINKFALILGNIVPDFLPSCFYLPHTYSSWYKWFNAKRYDLVNLSGYRYYYELGKEMHLCCDFFTRPHNRGVSGFIAGHHIWEVKLHRCVLENFKLETNVEDSVAMLHHLYLCNASTVEDDVKYASKGVSRLLGL